MRTTDQNTRKEMGCGYEPLVPLGLRRRRWTHRAYRGPAPTVCAGYTTRLPEVLEAATERLHWDKGALTEPLSEPMKLAIEVLEGAALDVEAWLRKPAKEGGGGP